MRILAIRFQNLNSLRGSHAIDLENGPLAQAGLFAITGPTGAGKSTILDAVTLALYGRAARYGRDSAEDMMSRGEGECGASVDFLCASGRFTAKWVLRRARGKPNGKLQSPVHELSQGGVILEERIQRVLNRIEELTELDYDRFLRSVLLAQGQFAAFLNANRDQRAGLLESITGSQIYSELGSLTHHISTGHTREIENESNRMKGIVFLTEEERTKVSGRITELTGELKTLEARLTSLQFRVDAGRRAVELQRQTEELARQTAEHAKAEASFAPEAARLALHAATEPFAEELAELAMAARAAATTAAGRATASQRAITAREKASLAAGIAQAVLAAGAAETAQRQKEIAEHQEKNTAEWSSARQWLEQHQVDAAVAGMLPHLSALVERAGFLTSQVETANAGLTKTRAAATAAEEKNKAAQELAATAASQSALAQRLAERVK
ncbi:MAG TPA: AAA family ATPase, partial [Verrucomicrobiales bacterium]|nr:AAA family ATPase [Verrucomicrobiales bacterium]